MGLIAVSDGVNLRGFHAAPNRRDVFTPIPVPRGLFLRALTRRCFRATFVRK